MISQPFWYLGIVDTNVLKTRNEDYQLIPRVPPCPKRFALFLTNSFWSIKSMIGGQNGFLAEYYNLNAIQGTIWKPWLLGSKSVCLSVLPLSGSRSENSVQLLKPGKGHWAWPGHLEFGQNYFPTFKEKLSSAEGYSETGMVNGHIEFWKTHTVFCKRVAGRLSGM